MLASKAIQVLQQEGKTNAAASVSDTTGLRPHLFEHMEVRFHRKAQVHFVPVDGADAKELEGCQCSPSWMC